MKTYYVYILLCSDKSYYVGVTNNIERRFFEHSNGYNPHSYTHTRRPVKLLKSYDFNNINYAIDFEKQLKGWSRAKKELFMKGGFEGLVRYSKKN